MFENVQISDDLIVPGIVFGNSRIIFEPCEDIHPDDPQGFFAVPHGALIIDSSKPRIYAKWLKQIMSGISDSQRYKGLPMRRINGTDVNGSAYSVVVIADSGNDSIQSLADQWAGYFSGHAYNIRVQDFKTFGDSGIWSYRDSDTVNPFFGDPLSADYQNAAIVAAYELIKD